MSASVYDWKYLNPSAGINWPPPSLVWPAPGIVPMDDTHECWCEHDCITPYDRLSPWSFVWTPPAQR